MRIDHVVYAVADLDAATRRFRDEYGLEAREGGEHERFGTRNAIVPVGDGQYVELMAVADPTSTSPVARTIAAFVAGGDRPVAVCLAPDDLDREAARLSLDVVAAGRRTPSGELRQWRMAGLDRALGPERLPFFIDWAGGGAGLDESINPGCAGIAWVEMGGDRAVVEQWVDGVPVPFRWRAGGSPGPLAVGVRRGDDVVVVS